MQHQNYSIPYRRGRGRQSDLRHADLGEDEVCMPGLQVTYPSNAQSSKDNSSPAIVSQDYNDLSQNTRAARRQRLLTTVEMAGSCPTARQAATRSYPL